MANYKRIALEQNLARVLLWLAKGLRMTIYHLIQNKKSVQGPQQNAHVLLETARWNKLFDPHPQLLVMYMDGGQNADS